MEFTKTEADVLDQTLSEVRQQEIRDLNDLQLALIGGGIGEVIVA